MDDKERNLLELGEYHILRSNKTKKPYIDENKQCYVIEGISDIKEMVKNIPDTYYDKKSTLNQSIYCNEFYSEGIEKIVFRPLKKEEMVIDITKGDIKKRFYANKDANFNLLLLTETSKKKYLRNLKSCSFITPVVLDPRQTKQYPKIHYCSAKIEEKTYFILFSTLQEFDKWNEGQGNTWKPLEVHFKDIEKERKGNDVLVNPLSEKLIIANKHIHEVLKEKD